MNAVARAVTTNETIIHGVLINLQLPELKVLVLIFGILLSALGTVYVKDLQRRCFIKITKLTSQQEQLATQSTKLLLEYSAWAAQERVQRVAQATLQMQIPAPAEVVVIKV